MAFSILSSALMDSIPSWDKSAATHHFRAVLVDLALDDLLYLAEIGGDVHVEGLRQRGHLGTAELIFNSASYFWIFSRTSPSFGSRAGFS